MTEALNEDVDPAVVIDDCLADLAANAPAETIFGRLRAIDAKVPDNTVLRARFLRVRAVLNSRLGFPTEALRDLQKARSFAENAADRRELAEIHRAVAVVHSWRGAAGETALALLRSAAAAAAADDQTGTAMVFIEAGRLELEIGRPGEAEVLLSLALGLSGVDLPAREKVRATVNLVQALVASEEIKRARQALASLKQIPDLLPRARLLAELESARIAQKTGDRKESEAALHRAEALVPDDPQCFETAELAHVKAEVALAQGDAEKAERLLADVISRYRDHDLAGREVVAGLLRAQALDALGRSDEAESTLAAALKCALGRRLHGYADAVRSRIWERGGAKIPWEETDSSERFARGAAIGNGGFGNVSRALDLDLGIKVALKRVVLESVFDPAKRQRLLEAAKTEVAAAARIRHPGVARIHTMLVDANGDALIIQELVAGPTLRAAIMQPMASAHALALLAGICRALDAVHAAGIVHRDLKPDNVILRGGTSPVIVDFGIALVGRLTGTWAGTRPYMAPEQEAGKPTDARADLHALGVMAHQLLVGELPQVRRLTRLSFVAELFDRYRRRERLLAAGVDPIVADLLARLLARHPRWRPASADAVAQEFEAIAKTKGSTVTAVSTAINEVAETRHGDVAPATLIDESLAALAANAPAEIIFGRLRAIDEKVPDNTVLRARFLRVRAVANSRLGFPTAALHDLHEARGLAENAADRRELAEIHRAAAVVHSWRGAAGETALALLRSAAAATAADDRTGTAMVFIEAGRVELEIGRAGEAEVLLTLALELSGVDLPAREKVRATVNLAQALVASNNIERARQVLAAFARMPDPLPRARFLAELESARIAQATGDRTEAMAALGRAERLRPSEAQCFETAELAHVKAEVALAQGEAEKAQQLLGDVICRYRDDDLAGREVVARLLQAQVLDALGRSEEAERTLAAALKRAVGRRLQGYADAVRARLRERGSAAGAWRPGDPLPGSDGTNAAERFVRGGALGARGSGNVSRAYDLDLGGEVALRRVVLESVYDPAERQRLLDAAKSEAAAAARIRHPGVACIHALLVDTNGDALIVQELIEGPTLRAAMAQPMASARVLDLLVGICYALSAVHSEGIVHRDLKPDNVILRGGTSPVIVDFGIALVGGRTGTWAGTPPYMAPEQGAGKPTDARADLHALGVMAHELLLGEVPQVQRLTASSLLTEPLRRRRRRERLLAAGVDQNVADLVARLLATHPRWRPASTAAVGKEFEAIAKATGSTAPPSV